ncbi:hypothetical protein [Segnochrobactrum spirostomi]|uniref:Uncharacterized protein n=1 Tax=Segnochrobactrum spirostomi TaxID=2608987 RepID=A0A6A7Y800_9HYPH|nr:hypothetical protein [Segnochrobactrum spirostomi]MQT13619.1 hypothetical protein [Segnochrobactrum spirostomi]
MSENLHGRMGSFWLSELPYIVMLILVLVGIAITSLVPGWTAGYWQLITVAFAAIAIASEWPRLETDSRWWRLVLVQVLHWGAIFLAMRVLFLPHVAQMLNSDSIGLAVLGLLALGTLLDGIHLASWPIAVVGVLLGLSVPAIAWLDQATVMITVIALALIAAGGSYIWYRRGGRFG